MATNVENHGSHWQVATEGNAIRRDFVQDKKSFIVARPKLGEVVNQLISSLPPNSSLKRKKSWQSNNVIIRQKHYVCNMTSEV